MSEAMEKLDAAYFNIEDAACHLRQSEVSEPLVFRKLEKAMSLVMELRCFLPQERPKKEPKPETFAFTEGPHMDAPVRAIGASVRLTNCLLNNQCGTLRDVLSHKRSDILRSPNMGKVAMAELDELLLGKLPREGHHGHNPTAHARYMKARGMRREGCSYKEIAQEMGCSIATAKRLSEIGWRIETQAIERSKFRMVAAALA